MHVISKLSHNISIKYKIFMSYIIILIATLSIVLTINTVTTVQEIKENTLYQLEKNLEQMQSFLEFKTLSTKNIVELICINDSLQTILERRKKTYTDDIGLWTIDTLQLHKIFYSATTNPDIQNIQLYMEKGPALMFETEEYMNIQHYKDTSWYSIIADGSNKIHWFTGNFFSDTNSKTVVALKKIPSKNNIHKSIGTIRVNIPINTIESNLNQSKITVGTKALLINSKEVIATSSNHNMKEDLINDLINYLGTEHDKHIQHYSNNNKKYYMGVQSIQYSDWKLVLLVPDEDITKAQRRSTRQFIMFLLLVAPLTFPFAYWISSSITKRITVLIKDMRNLEKERFNDSITSSSRDEIGILTQNFNHMMVKMAMLLDEKFEMGQEIKNMELKALQAQINPHFLYNTLDQIYWMGVTYHVPSISKLVIELSKFYKLSLSKGAHIVSLSNELEHIRAYVRIQNYRFDNQITLDIHISEDYHQLQLPKITLQPIVENAIIHGILEKESEKGTITITSVDNYPYITLRVLDDGIGMPENKLVALSKYQNVSVGTSGYGLLNIHSRLRLLYGEHCGLSYESQEGIGTTICITLPYD